jgi:hypothetical protein
MIQITNKFILNHEAEVVEKTKKLLDLTIKKFQDIVVMRGMIMHETSSLDIQKVGILEKYINSKNSLETKGLKDEILKEIKLFVDEKCNKYQDFDAKDDGLRQIYLSVLIESLPRVIISPTQISISFFFGFIFCLNLTSSS